MNNKYFKIYNWMVYALKLSGNNLIVFAYVFRYKTNGYRGSLQTLANECGIGRKTAFRAFEYLTNNDLLIKETQGQYVIYKVNFQLVKAKRDSVILTPQNDDTSVILYQELTDTSVILSPNRGQNDTQDKKDITDKETDKTDKEIFYQFFYNFSVSNFDNYNAGVDKLKAEWKALNRPTHNLYPLIDELRERLCIENKVMTQTHFTNLAMKTVNLK